MTKHLFKIALVLFFCLFANPKVTLAHGGGLPPVVSINGELVIQNTVAQGSYVSGLWIPEDKGAKNYLLDQSTRFEIDLKTLGILTPDANTYQVYWDFGDGQKLVGQRVEKKYSKIGSYFVNVYIGDAQTSQDQLSLVQSVLIHVVPTLDYKLPIAKISINAKPVVQSTTGIPLDMDLSNAIIFDASGSMPGSAPIKSYFWDLDDGVTKPVTSNQKSVQIKYSSPKYYAAPVLRITDNNGFVSDATIVLKQTDQKNEPKKEYFIYIISGIITCIIVSVIAMFLARSINKRKK